jgi:hypothetical protein
MIAKFQKTFNKWMILSLIHLKCFLCLLIIASFMMNIQIYYIRQQKSSVALWILSNYQLNFMLLATWLIFLCNKMESTCLITTHYACYNQVNTLHLCYIMQSSFKMF